MGAVEWLDSTFKSRERAAELLRPDLESGLITQHDFETAVRFLPGPHRYYPILYGVGSTTAFYAFGKSRRWSFTSPRTLGLGCLANFGGMILGQFQRAKGHLTFAKQLDDPTAFSQALQNVNARTGSKEPLRWALPGARKEDIRPGVANPTGLGQTGLPNEGDWIAEPQITPDIPSSSRASSSTPNIPQNTPTTATSTPRSRWDDIREANARAAAQNSAWDALRQQHEREKMLERQQRGSAPSSTTTSSASGTPGDEYGVTSPSGPPPSRYSDEDRAREQARFDAMLEMERKMSRQ